MTYEQFATAEKIGLLSRNCSISKLQYKALIILYYLDMMRGQIRGRSSAKSGCKITRKA